MASYDYGMWVVVAFNIGLFLAYVHLARQEEAVMYDRFGEPYRRYARTMPAFFPALKDWPRFLFARVADHQNTGGEQWKDS